LKTIREREGYDYELKHGSDFIRGRYGFLSSAVSSGSSQLLNQLMQGDLPVCKRPGALEIASAREKRCQVLEGQETKK
jgi:hypothetical protein